jgi:hypothetical protein
LCSAELQSRAWPAPTFSAHENHLAQKKPGVAPGE